MGIRPVTDQSFNEIEMRDVNVKSQAVMKAGQPSMNS
jgi:hypothetical protein